MGLTKKTLDKVINFILKTKDLNNKKMRVYSNEELLDYFPEHEKVDKKVIKKMIEEMYDKCERYQEIYNYFEDYINTCFPGSDGQKCNYSREDPDYKEYTDYLYNHKIDGVAPNDYDLYTWTKYASASYLNIKGQKHTFEEACQLAANKWCEMIFNFHLQDNGAINEDHAGGFWACALATAMKNDSIKEITEDVIKKVNEEFYKYYFNHCRYIDKEDGWTGHIEPYCDYGPNTPLYDILENGGVSKKHINSLCPWKTGIEIDENDNSVIIKGYQKRTYI